MPPRVSFQFAGKLRDRLADILHNLCGVLFGRFLMQSDDTLLNDETRQSGAETHLELKVPLKAR